MISRTYKGEGDRARTVNHCRAPDRFTRLARCFSIGGLVILNGVYFSFRERDSFFFRNPFLVFRSARRRERRLPV